MVEFPTLMRLAISVGRSPTRLQGILVTYAEPRQTNPITACVLVHKPLSERARNRRSQGIFSSIQRQPTTSFKESHSASPSPSQPSYSGRQRGSSNAENGGWKRVSALCTRVMGLFNALYVTCVFTHSPRQP